MTTTDDKATGTDRSAAGTDIAVRSAVADLIRRTRSLETRIADLEALDVDSLADRLADLEAQVSEAQERR
jgi:hypothetical protein